MSYQISFRYPGLSKKPEQEAEVVNRVARLICNNPHVFPGSGYLWELDDSNDWKMDRGRETDEYIVAYRYGGGGNVSHMDKLRDTIVWRLGIEHYNE